MVAAPVELAFKHTGACSATATLVMGCTEEENGHTLTAPDTAGDKRRGSDDELCASSFHKDRISKGDIW